MKNTEQWVPTKGVIRDDTMKPNLPSIYGGSYHTIKIQLQLYYSILKKYAKGDIADLGCGQVPYFECYKASATSIICADRIENKFTDTSIDLNSRFPFQDASFDAVLFSDVVNHIYDTDNLFSESNRILRSGGHLIIFTPFLYWISEAPYDFYRFTKFALQRKSELNDFEVVELFSYGKKRDVILDLLFKRLSRRYSFPFLRLLSDTFFSELHINRDFEPFPLGYILVAKKK